MNFRELILAADLVGAGAMATKDATRRRLITEANKAARQSGKAKSRGVGFFVLNRLEDG